MKPCVYAIYSHLNPAQVVRLVTTLRALSPRAHIVVHHDPSHTRISPDAITAAGAVLIPDPVRAEWGDFSQVRQHLRVMRWCVENLDFEWLVTLTGQTYPVKHLAGFEAFLAASPYDASLINFDAYDPQVWPKEEAERRYHYHYVKLPRFRYWHRVPSVIRNTVPKAIRIFNASQSVLRLFTYPKSLPTRLGIRTVKRPFGPNSMQLTGSNQNTNFSHETILTILEYVDTHPEYVKYFRRTALPDEAFFATILRNNPDLRLANDCLRHIYWPGGHSASGGVMDLQHLPALEASSAYFALKFDQDVCPELLDHLDTRLGLRPKGNPT